jgi:hypothetical protein
MLQQRVPLFGFHSDQQRRPRKRSGQRYRVILHDRRIDGGESFLRRHAAQNCGDGALDGYVPSAGCRCWSPLFTCRNSIHFAREGIARIVQAAPDALSNGVAQFF